MIQSNENETTQKVDQDAEQKQEGGSDAGSQEQDIDQDADLDNDTEQKNEAEYIGSQNGSVRNGLPGTNGVVGQSQTGHGDGGNERTRS